ncbi:alpha/beta hydrolase [Mucilaginibacter sp. HMF5004]|uniref:alpha/beta fold hydrolase n=1 Tax=Mucilaginibacter rivuli TaxID=2857527 RepID=UPI001C5CC89A|nr:alpha/beta fold hydrolase [Mucilaginibacter rivuli]MBW4891404.1 alpha/beta hydrolase [Mucilaginibacter rivuli]
MMMRRVLLCLMFVVSVLSVFAQTEKPNYATAIGKLKKYYNNSLPDSLFAMFAPAVKTSLPLDKTKELISSMHAQIGNLKQTTFAKYMSTAGVYKAEYENATLFINLSLNGYNQIDGLYFREYKEEKPTGANVPALIAAPSSPAISDPSLTESPFTLKTLAGTLSGTLTTPKNATGKIPVVLIIAGSGPTDRNCNSSLGSKTDAFKYLAEGLGKAGIASLRYDKRGVGQSTTSQKEKDTKFSDMSDDAGSVIVKLQEDDRFSKVIVLGHSEGSLVGMIACYSAENLAGFISVAGPGRTADVIIAEQMKSAPPSVAMEFKTIVDSLKKGKTTPKVDPALYALARPSVQPYLMSAIFIDPARVIKKIKLPVLIIQGNNDMQVSVLDAELLKKAKSEATLKIIDGMNHVLKQAPTDRAGNMATYNDPSLPVKPELITAIVDFIKGLKSK